MNICIIGGGINGLCCAWVLAQKGHSVDLYERDTLVSKTSRSSSKLLHGGLRYLEHGSFRLVKEALKERDAWLQRVPSLTKAVRLVLPIYKNSRRNRWLIKLGLFLYDNLTPSSALPRSKWIDVKALKDRDPNINTKGLIGGYEFSDGQMDDYKLGLWVAEQARDTGCNLYEKITVESIDTEGNIYFNNNSQQYDQVINVSGPWAVNLLKKSNIKSPYQLDAIRGSHLVINKICKQPYLFEVPNEKRIFFVLPWKGSTLIGTTEEKQSLDQPIECSKLERDYLLAAYNHYHKEKATIEEIVESFAGIRPLLSSTSAPRKATREYAIHKTGKLINVFGGKWTTALSLAHKVSQQVH